MPFNFVDLLVLGYVAFGVWRGGRRGLPHELPKAVSISAAFLTGFGMYRFTGRILTEASRLAGQTTGGLSLVVVFIGTLLIFFQLRRRVRLWAEKHFPHDDQRRWGGMVAGGVRSFVLCAIIVALASHLPLGFMKGTFSQRSFLGRNIARYVLPWYAKTASRPPTPTKSS